MSFPLPFGINYCNKVVSSHYFLVLNPLLSSNELLLKNLVSLCKMLFSVIMERPDVTCIEINLVIMQP